MANRNRIGWPAWLLLGSAALSGWTVLREVQRRLRPLNPKQALRYGMNLTRRPRRVLAITAHPDDLELFIAGTLRLLSLSGSSITVVVASGGDRQYPQRRSLDRIREQEQRDAGTVLGYDDIRFLRFSDLELATTPGVEGLLRRAWHEVQPDLVFAFDPTAPYRSATHPDHLMVGRVTLNIARSLGAEGPEVVFYGSRDPNVLVDISQVIEDKTQAIRCHRSQLYGWKRLYNPVMRLQARMAGRSVDVGYAEPLRHLSLPPLRSAAYAENWPPRPKGLPAGPQREPAPGGWGAPTP